MNRVCCFLMVICVGCVWLVSNGNALENINTPENFPDPAFRAIVERFMAVPEGGEFTAEQAAAKTGTLTCSSRGVGDMTGLRYLTGLTGLRCLRNALTHLDLSANTALTILLCQENQITALDVSSCPNLSRLDCSINQLQELNLAGCTALNSLNCSVNSLTALDISQCFSLATLDCSVNQLREFNPAGGAPLSTLNCSANLLRVLDISDCAALSNLNCSANELEGIDVTSNAALRILNCAHNELSELDVSGNPAIVNLNCSFNKLTRLDVRGAVGLRELLCRGDYFASGGNRLTSLDVSTNININTLDCSGNQLRSLASFMENPEIKRGDGVDVRYNNLGCGAWIDAQELISRLGEPAFTGGQLISTGFAYSPQEDSDPYSCEEPIPPSRRTVFHFESQFADWLAVSPRGMTMPEYSFGSLPSGSKADGQGLMINLNQNDGLTLYGPVVDVGDGLVLMQALMYCSGPDASPAIAALNVPSQGQLSDIDGSMGLNQDSTARDSVGTWYTMNVLYDPRGNAIVPVFQVVATSAADTTVYLDEIILTPLSALPTEETIETLEIRQPVSSVPA
ncbi:MAG: hypothetical protein ABIH23_32005, partial [bacterium]